MRIPDLKNCTTVYCESAIYAFCQQCKFPFCSRDNDCNNCNSKCPFCHGSCYSCEENCENRKSPHKK